MMLGSLNIYVYDIGIIRLCWLWRKKWQQGFGDMILKTYVVAFVLR